MRIGRGEAEGEAAGESEAEGERDVAANVRLERSGDAGQ